MEIKAEVTLSKLHKLIEEAIITALKDVGHQETPLTRLSTLKVPDVVWAQSACSRLHEVVAPLGRRPALVVDKGVFGLGLHVPALLALQSEGFEVPVYGKVSPEPDDAAVELVAAFMRRSQPDVLVAMGGGSAMDVAKAAIIAFENSARLHEYAAPAGLHIPRRRTGLVCIPTTSGSGSEATSVSVIIDSNTGRKMLFNAPSLMPDVALLDTQLTKGLPPKVAAACGMDALTHAIEGKCNINANTMTDAMTKTAIALIMDNLRDAILPDNESARECLALGSTLAAMGFSNCGVGACHAIAHQIGTQLGVSHGVANAVLLPHVLEMNCSKAPGRCDGLPTPEAIQRLSTDTGLPIRLRDAVAVRMPDRGSAHWSHLLGSIADAAMDDVCMAGNPVPLSTNEVIRLIETAW